MIVCGGLSGVLYMLVHAALGRMMDEVAYAQVVSLLGLMSVLSVLSVAMENTIARYIAEHAHLQAEDLWVTVFKRAISKITIFASLGLLIWCAISPWLRTFFDAPNVMAVIWVGVIAWITLYRPVVNGALQGGQQFGWVAVIQILTAGLRLIFCIIAAKLGFEASGVLGAVAASAFISILPGLLPIRKALGEHGVVQEYDSRPIYRYFWPVLLGQGALYLLMFGDVMLSARFLADQDLAVYGKAATLSRIVLFLAQPVAIAMFPRAVNSDNPKLFYAPLIFAGLCSFSAALIISLVPRIPMTLLYGIQDPAYLVAASWYVWAAVPLSLIAIAVKYLWARSRTRQVLLLVPLVLAYLAGLFFFHETPYQMMACLAAGSWGSLICILVSIIRTPSASEEP